MAVGLRVMTGLFQNGCHKNNILVTQFQQLNLMLDYDMTCTCNAFANIFERKKGLNIERNGTCSFQGMELL